jgi:hypothetical protein
MMKLNGLELQATTKIKWVRTPSHNENQSDDRLGTPSHGNLSNSLELQPTLVPQRNSIGLELQAMAKYQLNYNIKQLTAMLGAQATGHAECSHTDCQEQHRE